MLLFDAGKRIEPPVSEPMDPAQRPAATAVPEPLLEPPGAWSVFHGFRVSSPKPGGPTMASSLMVSLPSTMQPAAFNRAARVASVSGTRPLKALLPTTNTPGMIFTSSKVYFKGVEQTNIESNKVSNSIPHARGFGVTVAGGGGGTV